MTVPSVPRDIDEAVALEAQRWVGTPYRHQGSRHGVGCDCLGLVRGIWRRVLGDEPEAMPGYTPDWGELGREEPLLDAAHRHLSPSRADGRGTILIFRWHPAAPAKHCGILIAPDRMVHAYSGQGVVVSPLAKAWKRRIVGRFQFPRPIAE